MNLKIYVIPICLAGFIVGCTGPSEEKIKAASNACEKFIAKQMEPSKWSSDIETHIFETWVKNGNIVASVGYRDKYKDKKDTYSVRLCVYDEKNKTISSPSPLNDSEWRK